jgi:hypothetical protein
MAQHKAAQLKPQRGAHYSAKPTAQGQPLLLLPSRHPTHPQLYCRTQQAKLPQPLRSKAPKQLQLLQPPAAAAAQADTTTTI